MPDRLVITNTSPLFYLHQIDRLDLLQNPYSTITVPAAVQNDRISSSSADRSGCVRF
ncbi:hypothetical protein [Alkalinema sp. FACHB-956]|uniref:hypothetical protein n=1 Tax=Alkalinema sp. FACHB-956 TaxID=2692768 RepID=UPI0016843FEE|nr:hypothetical protein [Alkalinema sp. FACHB-956]MBD2326279.1 hypothetical protein [Alkalinema sp. FACHB-956]